MPYLWLGGDSWERQAGDGDNRALVSLDWTPSLQAEEVAADSDKSFTVPANTEWTVKTIWVEYTSDITVGDRWLAIEIQDGAADVIDRIIVGHDQTASLVRYYHFGPHSSDLTAWARPVDTDHLMTPIPEWILPAGYIVRVYDYKAVAAAGDTMIVQMMVLARTVA